MNITLRSKTLRGSGTSKREERDLGSFSALEARGSVEVEIVPGGTGPAVVEADDNLLEYLKTEVEDDTLRIWLDSDAVGGGVTGFQVQSPMRATVPISGSLSSIAAHGSSRVKVRSSLETEELELKTRGSSMLDVAVVADSVVCSVQGSGKLSVHGAADRCKAKVQGSGELEAAGLQTRTCKVKLSGSGSASVQASERIRADVSGSGIVRCRGDAEVDASTSGSGRVVRG